MKTVDFFRIQTRIVGIEGEPADHWATPLRPTSMSWISSRGEANRIVQRLFLGIPNFISFFVYFRLFKQALQFLQQINVKMSIQYLVPGFEHTTF